MKLSKQSLFSLALLTLLIVGILGLTNPVSSIITVDDVRFIPKYLDMQNTPYLTVRVELTDWDNETLVEEIDPTSVTLEDMIAPVVTSLGLSKKGKPQFFNAEFNGNAVKGMLWSILGHMEITMPKSWIPVPLDLTIRGALYNGTQWEGTGLVKIVNWELVNPLP